MGNIRIFWRIVFYLSVSLMFLVFIAILVLPIAFPFSPLLLEEYRDPSQNTFIVPDWISKFAVWAPLIGMSALLISLVSGYFAFFYGRIKGKPKNEFTGGYGPWVIIKDSTTVLISMLAVSFLFSFTIYHLDGVGRFVFWIPWAVGYYIICRLHNEVRYPHLITIALILAVLFISVDTILYTDGGRENLDLGYLRMVFSGVFGQVVAIFVATKAYLLSQKKSGSL